MTDSWVEAPGKGFGREVGGHFGVPGLVGGGVGGVDGGVEGKAVL